MPSPADNDNKNSKDPKLSVAGFIAVIWIEFSLAFFAVAFRVWIRLKKANGLQVDDYWVFLALACLLALGILQTLVLPTLFMLMSILHGTWNKPLPTNFYPETSSYLRLQFALIVLFWSCLWAVKGAFLAFYKTLFDNGFLGWQKVAWWIVSAFCLISYLGNLPVQFLACSPFMSYFTVGGCETPRDISVSNASLYYSTAVDIFSDLLIIALPITLLPKLRLDLRKKIALGVLFGTGFVIIVFSAIRLRYTKPDHSHVNPKWLGLMSSTEATIAVLASSAPAFRRLFTRPSGNSKSSSDKSSRKTPINTMDGSGPSQKSGSDTLTGNSPVDLKDALNSGPPGMSSMNSPGYSRDAMKDDSEWRKSDFLAGNDDEDIQSESLNRYYRKARGPDAQEDYESGYQ